MGQSTTTFIDKIYKDIPFEDIADKISKLDTIYDFAVKEMDRINEETKDIIKKIEESQQPENLTEKPNANKIRDGLAKDVALELEQKLFENGLLTTKLSSDIVMNTEGIASISFIALFCRSEYQSVREKLLRQKEIGDKIFPDIEITSGFVEKQLNKMEPGVAKGAIEILDDIKMNFISDPENIKDKAAIRGLMEQLDTNGLVTAGMAAAYSQGNVDKIIRSMEGLSSNLEKIVSKGPAEKPGSIGIRIAGAMIADQNPLLVILGGLLALGVKSVELVARLFSKETYRPNKQENSQDAFRAFTKKRMTENQEVPYSISPKRAYARAEKRGEMAAEDLSARRDVKFEQGNAQNNTVGLKR